MHKTPPRPRELFLPGADVHVAVGLGAQLPLGIAFYSTGWKTREVAVSLIYFLSQVPTCE